MKDYDNDNVLEVKNSQKNPTPKKKNNAKKDKKAKNFLGIMLCFVIVFVCAVCIFINGRNKAIIKDGASTTQGTKASQGSDGLPVAIPHATNPGDTETQKNETTLKSTTEKETTTEKATTEKATTEPMESTTVKAEKPAVDASIKAQLEIINNPEIISISEDKWNLTIVNRSHRIPGDYNPDLVYVCGSGERLDRKIAPHYEKMYKAALEDGVTLTPCSGYRSYETQERIFNRKIDFFKGQGFSEDEAKVKAARVIMPPGSSEHNLGYAMDIVCVDEWFEDTKEFEWLKKNAADYGFIMRYPKEKQDVTKVIYEPWHWRYVGVENAKAIKASGKVMEEFFGVKA